MHILPIHTCFSRILGVETGVLAIADEEKPIYGFVIPFNRMDRVIESECGYICVHD